MTQRLRSSEIAICCAVILFTVAWLPLNRLRDPRSEWHTLAQSHPAIGMSLTLLNAAGCVAILALLAAGLPVLGSALGRSFAVRYRALLRLLEVPPWHSPRSSPMPPSWPRTGPRRGQPPSRSPRSSNSGSWSCSAQPSREAPGRWR